MARDWDESEHPRHRQGRERGRFRDKTGDWADMLSSQMLQLKARPWIAGQWEEIGSDEFEQNAIERISNTMREYGTDPDEHPEILESALQDIEIPERSFANGPHRIHQYETHGREEWPIEDLLHEVDRLLGAFPLVEPLNMNLRPTVTMSTQGNADGASLMGSGLVQLSEKVLGVRSTTPGHFMPVRLGSPYWQYALVHEWGHLIDVEGKMLSRNRVTGPKTMATRLQRTELWSAHGDPDQGRRDLSRYGRQSDNEGVAEAFVEWYLSMGQTRNNAAREYARHYGWDKTWP